MHDFDRWISAVSQQLGLTAEVDEAALLEVARDVAHQVSRPATPVTAYLMGLAVGAGADPAQVMSVVRQQAVGWEADKDADEVV